jgi:hypothetical protein
MNFIVLIQHYLNSMKRIIADIIYIYVNSKQIPAEFLQNIKK